jgi:hypothetical protein
LKKVKTSEVCQFSFRLLKPRLFTVADKLVKLLILECKLIVTPFSVKRQECIELNGKTFYIYLTPKILKRGNYEHSFGGGKGRGGAG